MKELPKLYKTTSSGKTQTWQIVVDGSETFTRFGAIGDSLQTSAREKAVAKNVGKKNETTAEEQALLDATSKWNKKLSAGGYVQKQADATQGAADCSITGGIWPTLAKVYKKDGHKITFPAYAQPKLDGHRCVAQYDAHGKVTLWSRKRKQITSMPHIIKALEELPVKDFVLDGELFCASLSFEDMAHFIRKPAPQPGGEAMEYHVFDCVIDDDFSMRTEILSDLFEDVGSGPLVLVETTPVANEAELMDCFETFVSEGHEGAMVRNAKGGYYSHPTHRDSNLQKLKLSDDSEFKIVAVKEGKGKLAGHGIFTCKTDAGVEFDVKLKGKISALKAYFDRPETAIGKLLTVQYQGMTGAAGVPRFPVGLRIRED